MTVSSSSSMTLLESALASARTRENIGVTMLKKAQDTATQQAQAMIEMVEKSAVPPTDYQGLDVYA